LNQQILLLVPGILTANERITSMENKDKMENMDKTCVKIFKLTYCGYCRRALQYVDELRAENPEFDALNIELIDEREQAEEARKHDYYYVPTFYVDDKKIHEGAVTREQVEEILRRACEKGNKKA
jgi:glutaredoxin